MTLVHELEIWGYPGRKISIAENDRIMEKMGAELGLPATVLIPYHSIPDDTDVNNLAICLLENELTLEAFTDFCLHKNLNADIDDKEAANEFLTYSFGQKLAWLHLPEAYDNALFLSTILGKLKEYSCSLVDPESLACLTHSTELKPAGSFPPLT